MEVDPKKGDNDSLKKSSDDKSSTASTPTEDSTPRINPVKWTVNNLFLIN